MSAPYESSLNGFFSLVSEWIDDDDLRAKLEFEKEKLKFELDKTLLGTSTTPKVDAFVKLLIATRDIIIPMMRPVGSLALAGFAAYCAANDIMLPDYVQVMLYGAPVGYGVSRHNDKKEKEKTKRAKIKQEELYDEDNDSWGD